MKNVIHYYDKNGKEAHIVIENETGIDKAEAKNILKEHEIENTGIIGVDQNN